MPSHRVIVATGFRVAGWVLGVPSLLACVGLTVESILLHHAARPDRSAYLDVGTYGLVGLLANGAHALHSVAGFLAGVGAWVAAALAILALFAALASVALYVTGRGLGRRASWARVLAGLMALGLLLVTLGAWSLIGRDAAPLACAFSGVWLYCLWVLGWRFA